MKATPIERTVPNPRPTNADFAVNSIHSPKVILENQIGALGQNQNNTVMVTIE